MLDATVGQNGVTQAREFIAAAGVTGIVLDEARRHGQGRRRRRHRQRFEGADSLRRRRRRHRRPGAVFSRRVRRRAVRGKVVTDGRLHGSRAVSGGARPRADEPQPDGRRGRGRLPTASSSVRDSTSGRGRRTRRCRRSTWPARARAGRRCIARSSLVAIRAAPVRARRGSSTRASRGWWRRRSIRIRAWMVAASRYLRDQGLAVEVGLRGSGGRPAERGVFHADARRPAVRHPEGGDQPGRLSRAGARTANPADLGSGEPARARCPGRG